MEPWKKCIFTSCVVWCVQWAAQMHAFVYQCARVELTLPGKVRALGPSDDGRRTIRFLFDNHEDGLAGAQESNESLMRFLHDWNMHGPRMGFVVEAASLALLKVPYVSPLFVERLLADHDGQFLLRAQYPMLRCFPSLFRDQQFLICYPANNVRESLRSWVAERKFIDDMKELFDASLVDRYDYLCSDILAALNIGDGQWEYLNDLAEKSAVFRVYHMRDVTTLSHARETIALFNEKVKALISCCAGELEAAIAPLRDSYNLAWEDSSLAIAYYVAAQALAQAHDKRGEISRCSLALHTGSERCTQLTNEIVLMLDEIHQALNHLADVEMLCNLCDALEQSAITIVYAGGGHCERLIALLRTSCGAEVAVAENYPRYSIMPFPDVRRMLLPSVASRCHCSKIILCSALGCMVAAGAAVWSLR